jgi:hypothetical protein
VRLGRSDGGDKPRTHLAVAPEVQEHLEMREGRDEVGDVVRLGGLERSTPRIPVSANFCVAVPGWFPFVSL